MVESSEAGDSPRLDTSASATHENRVCIVGCGHVGMASAYALIQSTFVRELVLVGRSRDKTEGEVMDLQHAVAVPMKSPIRVINGTYADAARSSVVVIAAGAATGEPGVSRLDLLSKNVGMVREIVGALKAEGFDGVLIMASNPVDVLARIADEVSGLPNGRVIGTGTLVDTAHLRGLLAEKLGVEPRAVDAFIIGEHGDSEVAVWSGVHVAGLRLDRYPGTRALGDYDNLLRQVRQAAPEVIKRKGHTAFAIGLCVQRICEAVLRNNTPSCRFRPNCWASTGCAAYFSARPASLARTAWNALSRSIWIPLRRPVCRLRRPRSGTVTTAFDSAIRCGGPSFARRTPGSPT